MEKDDNELVKDYLEGKEGSFETIVKRYTRPLYSFVWRLCGNKESSEDIVQETFLKVWKNIEKFDRERNFKVWIYAIARNSTFDFLRKKKLIMFSEMDNIDEDSSFEENIADTSPIADKIFEDKETSEMINQIINALPEKYKEVVILRHETGMTFEDISSTLKEPMNTVKSRYRRAVIKMQESLKMHQKIAK
ncbi:MAG: sigma-70 family RNA polymerase sigma factor [bacterium]